MRAAWIGASGMALVLMGAAAAGVAKDADPLAGLVLGDVAGRPWRLDELAGAPVLVVVAERRDTVEGDAWGARLAAAGLPLARWRQRGRVAWLAVADLRRVPPWARRAARERLEERARDRDGLEGELRSPLLLDWKGRVAKRLAVERGGASVVLLSAAHAVLAREHGPPTDEAEARLVAAVRRAASDA